MYWLNLTSRLVDDVCNISVKHFGQSQMDICSVYGLVSQDVVNLDALILYRLQIVPNCPATTANTPCNVSSS